MKGEKITEGEIAGALTRAAIENCMRRLATFMCCAHTDVYCHHLHLLLAAAR